MVGFNLILWQSFKADPKRLRVVATECIKLVIRVNGMCLVKENQYPFPTEENASTIYWGQGKQQADTTMWQEPLRKQKCIPEA